MIRWHQPAAKLCDQALSGLKIASIRRVVHDDQWDPENKAIEILEMNRTVNNP